MVEMDIEETHYFNHQYPPKGQQAYTIMNVCEPVNTAKQGRKADVKIDME